MFEGCVLIGFGLMLLAGLWFPFRQQRSHGIWVLLFGFAVLAGGYSLWGNWSGWRAQVVAIQRVEQAKKLMRSFKNADEVIQQLKKRLDRTPKHAKGWFLLGRIYASQGNWQAATEAFAVAHALAPTDETYFVQSLLSQWQAAGQQMSPALREQFHALLKKYPQQPDILACLAMDAAAHHHVQVAKQYWRQLLAVLPASSKEAKWVRQQIANLHLSISD